jgi:hypothetical protein
MDNFKVNICQVKTTGSFERSCTLYMIRIHSHFPVLQLHSGYLLSLLCIYIFQISYEMQYFGNLDFQGDNTMLGFGQDISTRFTPAHCLGLQAHILQSFLKLFKHTGPRKLSSNKKSVIPPFSTKAVVLSNCDRVRGPERAY